MYIDSAENLQDKRNARQSLRNICTDISIQTPIKFKLPMNCARLEIVIITYLAHLTGLTKTENSFESYNLIWKGIRNLLAA